VESGESSWACVDGKLTEDFTHAADEVMIVVEGDMEFEVEGEVHRPEPGAELLIPAAAVNMG
jgi:quercetin dioxygenase-like cupin family protein